MRKWLILGFILCAILLVTSEPKAFLSKLFGPKTYTNSIGIEFILIPAGSFQLITDTNEFGEPIFTKVNITKPFYMSKYPITQEQYVKFGRDNYSVSKGRNNPIECSIGAVRGFIRNLNEKENTKKYRLPTDMEWEYAARGGTDSLYFFMQDSKDWKIVYPGNILNEKQGTKEELKRLLDIYAWFKDNSNNTTHPVGQKKPNPYGLYDIYGNVAEWVGDVYDRLPKEREITDYRRGLTKAEETKMLASTTFAGELQYVVRNCGVHHNAEECTSSSRGRMSIARYFEKPDDLVGIGFRIVFTEESSTQQQDKKSSSDPVSNANTTSSSSSVAITNNSNSTDNSVSNANTTSSNNNSAATSSSSSAEVKISKISPEGELANMFNIGSNYTDLARETKLQELQGKTVIWSLPVYEIRKQDRNKYEVNTSGTDNYVGCEIHIIATSKKDQEALLSLKTGDDIIFKGTFSGKTSMRKLVIQDAAILKVGDILSSAKATLTGKYSERYESAIALDGIKIVEGVKNNLSDVRIWIDETNLDAAAKSCFKEAERSSGVMVKVSGILQTEIAASGTMLWMRNNVECLPYVLYNPSVQQKSPEKQQNNIKQQVRSPEPKQKKQAKSSKQKQDNYQQQVRSAQKILDDEISALRNKMSSHIGR